MFFIGIFKEKKKSKKKRVKKKMSSGVNESVTSFNEFLKQKNPNVSWYELSHMAMFETGREQRHNLIKEYLLQKRLVNVESITCHDFLVLWTLGNHASIENQYGYTRNGYTTVLSCDSFTSGERKYFKCCHWNDFASITDIDNAIDDMLLSIEYNNFELPKFLSEI